MNEKAIIQLVKNGEQQAYQQLVERYQTGLIIYCENIVKDREAAEDIAQDSFIKAYYTIKKYKPDHGAFSTWLYSIAANKAKDYLRKHNRKAADVELFDMPAVEPLSKEQISDIRRAIDRLNPPEYADVIKNYYWGGKSYQAIANDMNIPVATVGTWLSRAKEQLRKELL